MQNRFSEFLENNRIPEGLSNIFEDSNIFSPGLSANNALD